MIVGSSSEGKQLPQLKGKTAYGYVRRMPKGNRIASAEAVRAEFYTKLTKQLCTNSGETLLRGP